MSKNYVKILIKIQTHLFYLHLIIILPQFTLEILFKISRLAVLSILLLFQGIFVSEAFAYIDPGSGSVVIQMLIGALVGVGITVKVFWVKLKYKFQSLLKK